VGLRRRSSIVAHAGIVVLAGVLALDLRSNALRPEGWTRRRIRL
jgi:hypothetical protein